MVSDKCSSCKQRPTINSPVLKVYLYPVKFYRSNNNIDLFCPNHSLLNCCSDKFIAWIRTTFNTSQNKFINITRYHDYSGNYWCHDNKKCKNLIYDPDYILYQANIAHKKGIL